MSVDLANPLHQASFYVEELKYGERPGTVDVAGQAEFVKMLRQIIFDSGANITEEQMLDALGHYGDSLAVTLNLSPLIARSIFVDGVLHGMALAAGLRGEPR